MERAAAVKKLLFVAVTALILAFAAGPASAQYQPMFITVNPTTVPVGGTIVVTAGYFEPGSDVEIRVESDPVVLGTLVARADGTVTSPYALPLSVVVGQHVVFAKGPRLGTNVVTEVSAAITVIDANVSDDSIATGPGAAGSNSGNLPRTGTDAGIFAAVGAALLVAGGLIVMSTRRRHAARA
jgi:LPXTG-motif cell wall-anchored protein